MSKFETKNILLHSRICLIVNFAKQKKILNLGPKNSYFGISGLDFSETLYCYFCNQHRLIYGMAKFSQNVKFLAKFCN